jgi:5-methylcytosine-specific restriction endonuclease McrA
LKGCFVVEDSAGVRGVFGRRRRAEHYLEASCKKFTATLSPGVLKDAIYSLRKRVFERDEWRCVKCGGVVTWDSGHLHEKLHRGRGGDRTVENCETLCVECHVGRRGEHGLARRRRLVVVEY